MTTPTAQFHLPSFDSTYNFSAIHHQFNQQKFQPPPPPQYNLTSAVPSHQQEAAVTAAALAYVQAYNSPPRDIFVQSPQQQHHHHHPIESSDLFTTYPSPGESSIMTESPTHSPPTFNTTTTGEHKPVINGDGGYQTNSPYVSGKHPFYKGRRSITHREVECDENNTLPGDRSQILSVIPTTPANSLHHFTHLHRLNSVRYPTAPYTTTATSTPPSSYIPSNGMHMDRRSSLGAGVPVLPILHQPFTSHDTKVHGLPHQDLSTTNGSAEQQWNNGNSPFPFGSYAKPPKGFDEKAIDPSFFTDPSMVKPSSSGATASISYYGQNPMYDRNVMPQHPGGFPTPQDYPLIAGRFAANGTITAMSAANGNGTPKQSQSQSRPPPVPAPQAMMTTFSSKTVSSTPKRYKCNVCQKRFTRPSSLQTHMYSHTGEKPFKCPVEGCGRHFSVVSNLRRHQKIHANNTNSTASS